MKIIAGFLIVSALYAQTPQFDAASLKLLPPGQPNRARTADRARISYPSVSLFALVRETYRAPTPQQIEGPLWMKTTMYALEATLPPGASQDQIPEMLQSLLTERLKLTVHHQSRSIPTNILLVGKSKLRQVPEPDADLELKLEPPLVRLTGKASIAQLIAHFNHALGGPDPWVDRTGLTGFYAIQLEYQLDPPANAPSAQSAADSVMPLLPQALSQQLGLRVEVKKEPADFIIVDRVEKTPTEN